MPVEPLFDIKEDHYAIEFFTKRVHHLLVLTYFVDHYNYFLRRPGGTAIASVLHNEEKDRTHKLLITTHKDFSLTTIERLPIESEKNTSLRDRIRQALAVPPVLCIPVFIPGERRSQSPSPSCDERIGFRTRVCKI